MRSELQHLLVARHDRVGARCDAALQNPVVRVVVEYAHPTLRTDDRGQLGQEEGDPRQLLSVPCELAREDAEKLKVRYEQALANDFFVNWEHPTYGNIKMLNNPIKLSNTPAENRCKAPELGEDTDDILKALGYGEDEIGRMHDAGIV